MIVSRDSHAKNAAEGSWAVICNFSRKAIHFVNLIFKLFSSYFMLSPVKHTILLLHAMPRQQNQTARSFSTKKL